MVNRARSEACVRRSGERVCPAGSSVATFQPLSSVCRRGTRREHTRQHAQSRISPIAPKARETGASRDHHTEKTRMHGVRRHYGTLECRWGSGGRRRRSDRYLIGIHASRVRGLLPVRVLIACRISTRLFGFSGSPRRDQREGRRIMPRDSRFGSPSDQTR